MNRGGVETWLMHVLRKIDRKCFQMDFLVHTSHPAAYDDEIRTLGSRIIPCLNPHQPLTYARRLKRVLREYGPFDIVHSHVHHYSGWVMRKAWQTAVPRRIAHSYSDTSHLTAKAGFLRRLYLDLTKYWISRYATHGLACSKTAAEALFGPTWKADTRWRILYCGIDLEPFRSSVDRRAIRLELAIPADAFVVGHVGRFVEPKNHEFLVEIAAEVVRRRRETYFLLVGDGPLRSVIEEKVKRLGLTDHCIFTGIYPNVSRLMLGAMDVFVLPSLYEGLPVVSLEAQSAGLPLVLSDSVTTEACVVSDLVRWLSVSQSPDQWAETLLATRRDEAFQIEAVCTMQSGPFNISSSVESLSALYENGI